MRIDLIAKAYLDHLWHGVRPLVQRWHADPVMRRVLSIAMAAIVAVVLLNPPLGLAFGLVALHLVATW